MELMPIDRPLTVDEWESLEDPPGGRYEILDGRLVVSPSPDGEHNRFAEDLADLFRWAIRRAGRSYDVTIDVEWRSVDGRVVRDAPRGDVVVGRLDDATQIHLSQPELVVEVWDLQTRPVTRTKKRNYWASKGVRHYWQVVLDDPIRLEIYDLVDPTTARRIAFGSEQVQLTEPFPVDIVPEQIAGWTMRQLEDAEQAHLRAEAEARRAEAEARRAEAEARRADAEAERARAAEARAAELEARLRQLEGG